MAAIAQADRPSDWAFEAKTNGKAGIDRRLGAALPTAHEMPERERLNIQYEDLAPAITAQPVAATPITTRRLNCRAAAACRADRVERKIDQASICPRDRPPLFHGKSVRPHARRIESGASARADHGVPLAPNCASLCSPPWATAPRVSSAIFFCCSIAAFAPAVWVMKSNVSSSRSSPTGVNARSV
jgi:hypothetical protein